MPRGSVAGAHHAQKFRWAPWRERFESKIDRTQSYGPDGTCHRWTGTIVGYPGNQYGVIGIDGRRRRAHQVAWEILNDRPFPDGMLGRHTCDMGLCVNGEHVIPGTQQQNMDDARERGRINSTPTTERARGEQHGNAVLTKAEVKRMRKMHMTGAWTITDLAEHFRIGWSTADKVVKRKTWRHIS